MRLLSVTVETTVTKNLGNYQSVKGHMSLSISLDLPFDSHSFEEEFYAALDLVNSEMESQLRTQLVHAQRAMIEPEKEAF